MSPINLLAGVLLPFALTFCFSGEKKDDVSGSKGAYAQAMGKSLDGKISLRAIFKESSDGVTLKVEATGLEPNAQHGFHIHEKGECNPPDFMSAGPHFDPKETGRHGDHGPDTHMGDLGNLVANQEGVAKTQLNIKKANLTEGPTNLMGRSLVLHAKPDDLESQPTGDSGDRILCVVIKAATPRNKKNPQDHNSKY